MKIHRLNWYEIESSMTYYRLLKDQKLNLHESKSLTIKLVIDPYIKEKGMLEWESSCKIKKQNREREDLVQNTYKHWSEHREEKRERKEKLCERKFRGSGNRAPKQKTHHEF